MKKTNKSVPNAGFYGPEYGSPQNVEFGKCGDLSYLKAGQIRALEVETVRRSMDTIGRKLKNLAEYQGGGTTCFKKEM